ncbi:hypothetical protein L915_09810 [Phytophthora nicotianae]|uniref:ZSWIM3 N-terminal domain-containing protein n=1 Tax=Phytophthora nicotianae TaxID=4792 RepID=W2GSR9_PHYNI|nr:hypothetical protein L915_09810 [Phytophthora nicotianae]
MQSLHADRDEIINVVAPFPSRSISDWEEFNDVLDGYKKRNNLKFRVRSSQTTVLCNSTHDDQLPSEYRYAYKIFRCVTAFLRALARKATEIARRVIAGAVPGLLRL